MKHYTNSLGIVCLEPDRGYILKKGNNLYKKVYLNVNDKIELYEEVIDEDYVYEEDKNENPYNSPQLIKLKKELIKLSKAMLSEYLSKNPLFSRVKYLDGRYYTVDQEHQSRLTSQLLLYQGNTELGLDYQLTWNDKDGVCEDWTFKELFTLSNEINAYVKPLVKQQQELEIKINSVASVEELNNIKIEYGR